MCVCVCVESEFDFLLADFILSFFAFFVNGPMWGCLRVEWEREGDNERQKKDKRERK